MGVCPSIERMITEMMDWEELEAAIGKNKEKETLQDILDKKIKHPMETVTIVAPSSGLAGEDFAKHEVDIAVKRLKEFGLNVKFAEHAMENMEYMSTHPKERAEDLITALEDPDTDMILFMAGGDDSYRLAPYLVNDERFIAAAKDSEKAIVGFSDCTMVMQMLANAGAKNLIYGMTAMSDLGEIGKKMPEYSKEAFEELVETGTISTMMPSNIWYSDRTDYSESQIGTELEEHRNKGYEILKGSGRINGRIMGGCIECMYDMLEGRHHPDSGDVCRENHVFPEKEKWERNIILLETSSEKPEPDKYRMMVQRLKQEGIFDKASGVLVGMPVDKTYQEEYHQILLEELGNKDLKIMGNVNVGHSLPRGLMPLNVPTVVDMDRQIIRFNPEMVREIEARSRWDDVVAELNEEEKPKPKLRIELIKGDHCYDLEMDI